MWREFGKNNLEAVAQMEAFVRAHDKGHFMQLPQWAEVKTHWRWRGILVYHQDQPVAAMSILIRSLPLGFSLFYAPRGPVCDRNDRRVWNMLMTALKQIAKKHRAVLLYMDPDEFDTNHEFRAILRDLGFWERADEGFGNIQPQHVFRLNLTAGQEADIFKAFSSKTRYNIGLSQRKGVTVRSYSGANEIPKSVVESFSSLMEVTGARDHFCVRRTTYFQGLMKALQGDARLFIAYLDGQPIAGAIEVFCGKKAWYLYGASSNEHRNTMPNYLLQWTMIRRAMEQGCEVYDFRGVPGNPSEDDPLYGLYRFKKGFSGTYTKFTGLFTYYFHPICGTAFEKLMKLRHILRTRRK